MHRPGTLSGLLFGLLLVTVSLAVTAQASGLQISGSHYLATGSAPVTRLPVSIGDPVYQLKTGDASTVEKVVLPLRLQSGPQPVAVDVWLTLKDGAGRVIYTSPSPVPYTLRSAPTSGTFQLGAGVPRATIASYSATICGRQSGAAECR